jgi:peptidoglycan hydrolase CwlO-like protein
MVHSSSIKEGNGMEESENDEFKNLTIQKKNFESKLGDIVQDNNQIFLKLRDKQDEIDSLKRDLEERNKIIENLQLQLAERHTKMVETQGSVEKLQLNLEQEQKESDFKNKELQSLQFTKYNN